MAKENYDFALAQVLKYEGGYTNHPADPGGPTNFGITLNDARRYWKKDATAMDVKNMPLYVAKTIYRQRYWDSQNCDALPSGVDFCVFDYGVNSGIGRSKKVLVKFEHIADPVSKVNAICDERMAFLHNLKTFNVFGKGWTTRVANVRKEGIRLAKNKPTAGQATAQGTGILAAIGGFLYAAYHWGATHWPYFIAAAAAGLVIYTVVDIIKFVKKDENDTGSNNQ